MCGRFAFFHEIDALTDSLGNLDFEAGELHTRFNIPPTAPIYIVTESLDSETGEMARRLEVARWGLLPVFAKDPSASVRTFNARSETLAEKPSFRPSLKAHRAIIPISGYFEWKADEASPKVKQPYFIRRKDGKPMLLAGLYWPWRAPASNEVGETILTATIITKSASGPLNELHPRVPVQLTTEGAEHWLSPTQFASGTYAHAWINSGDMHAPHETLEFYPVSKAVGNVREQGAGLIEPLDISDASLF